jgi:hypothetical protein
MSYARGKYAFGFCDRTGFRYPLKDLVPEYKNGVKTGLLVGRDVVDPDHPQNFLGRVKIFDPQSLRNPRPDPTLREVFVPVGNGVFPPVDFLNPMLGQVGSVIATGSASSSTVTLTGVNATGSVGSATAVAPNVSISISGTSATGSLGTVAITSPVIGSFTVTVASYYGANKYYIGGSRQATVNLNEGSTYRFDQSDSSNSGHPLRLSTTSDGTHGGGSEYTTGVTTVGTPGNSGAYTQITVASGAPTLYYYCTNHSGMGGQANTP